MLPIHLRHFKPDVPTTHFGNYLCVDQLKLVMILLRLNLMLFFY